MHVGQTPQKLLQVGAEPLPIMMTQKTLKKITRAPDASKSISAHGLSRRLVESIPVLFDNPVFVINEMERQTLAIISDMKDTGGFSILLALKLGVKVNGIFCNELKSAYGKEHIKEYLEKQRPENVIIMNNKKAKEISRLAGLRLPAAWKSLDYNTNLPQNPPPVNQNKEKSPCLPRSPEEIAKNIQACGFRATSGLIHNVCKLDRLSGRDNTLRDICGTYKNNCDGLSKEETEIVREIAAECRQQELQRPAEPLEPEP